MCHYIPRDARDDVYLQVCRAATSMRKSASTLLSFHTVLPLPKDSHLTTHPTKYCGLWNKVTSKKLTNNNKTQKDCFFQSFFLLAVTPRKWQIQERRFPNSSKEIIQKNCLVELREQNWKSYHGRRERLFLLESNHWHFLWLLNLLWNVMVHQSFILH